MRDHPDAIMLFAAGFGTRMGTLTRETPKPLLRVAGHTLLDHTLTLAQGISPRAVAVNTHYHPEKIERHLSGTGVRISLEAPEILETGGGLRHALPLLGEGPVFTSNTDAVWRGPNPFKLLQASWNPEHMDALLLCLPKDNALGHKGAGDFVLDTAGRATRGPGVVYSGVQILKTDGLAAIPQKSFSLNLLWDKMLKTNRLHALLYPGQWCDVGSPDGLRLAESLLAQPHV